MMPNILVAVAILAQMSVNTPTPPLLRGEDLMRALQSGGYTILVRHARTDRNASNKETPGETPPLRADQRNLTADGEKDVRLMRAVVQKYRFPISEVLTSPVYRCRETADAFGSPEVTLTLRKIPMTAETEALVAAAPKRGTNRVLVTHHFVIEKYVPGITPGAIDESEAAVVRPGGDGKVVLVGKIALADWQALAGEAKAAAAPAVVAPATAVQIPSTRAGSLASRYFEAYNSGDVARMRTFIETSMIASAERPTEVRLESYAKMLRDFGTLTVTDIQSATDDAIVLGARSKSGSNLIITVTAAMDVDRLKSLTVGMPGGHP
jgi:phosphohistidine phosphatase SixA